MAGREQEWTVEEANAALDRVRAAVRRVQALVAAARERAGRQAPASFSGNGHRNGQAPDDPGAAELRAALDELAGQDILLRDLDSGLVDFPARSPSGRRYWLCWLIDEPEVAWWHWPHTGFADRTPLSDPPE